MRVTPSDENRWNPESGRTVDVVAAVGAAGDVLPCAGGLRRGDADDGGPAERGSGPHAGLTGRCGRVYDRGPVEAAGLPVGLRRPGGVARGHALVPERVRGVLVRLLDVAGVVRAALSGLLDVGLSGPRRGGGGRGLLIPRL